MGIAKLYGQKASGTNINGIIKDYYVYAGSNVSAGDLVEYINGVAGQTTETQVRPTTSSKFDGVAKTSGVGGTSTAHNQQVSIYTLESA